MKSAVISSFVVAAVVFGTASPRAQQAPAQRPAQAPPRAVFRGGTELVTVNVVVRDKSGNVVRDLKQDDFIVSEDDKPQSISSFDFEELDRADAAMAAEMPASPVLEIKKAAPKAAEPAPTPAPVAAPMVDMHGRRLIVLFFDLSSMQPEEIDRAVKAAHDYVDNKLAPSDLIAVASFSTSYQVNQDFTADKALVGDVIDKFNGANGQGFAEGGTGDTEGTADDGNSFTADDTEFNIFNTDRRLDALQTLSDQLAGIEQKKSVIYFSSGMSQNGSDNQVELRRTEDRANRANVSIYAADMRGLQAQVPGGDASQASTRGRSAFSGASVSSQFDRMASTQDTLSTLSEDTGGRAFFDSNSFGDVFNRVVADTSAYYILGYSSTNPARDGKYRRIKVRLAKRTDLKLENRSGYYAPRDFAHAGKDDRDQQMQDQLLSDLSLTDLTTYISPAYFRLGDGRFFVPLSIVIPGYQVPFTHSTDKNKSTIDVLAVVRDSQNRAVGRIKDTVKIALAENEDLKKKTVQYETGLPLAPGKFHVKAVVRENMNGTMGSYETDFVVPDLKNDTVKLSSVVVGTSLQSGVGRNPLNPLVSNGRELVPNVTHVVTPGQHLYFYYEVYDPKSATADAGQGAKPGIKVVTSIAFFRGKVRAFETPAVETTELSAPDRKSAVFQFDVPAASLLPGLYTCQINVVDDVAGAFTFPRMQLLVKK